MATWTRGFDVSESVKVTAQEWEEHWNVRGYDPPLGQPAWPGLLFQRPDLSPGQPHPTVPGAYVEGFEPERVTNGADAWKVAVRYSRQREQVQLELPPAARPAVIDLSYESVEVPTFTMQDGTPWLNKAGDLLGDITTTENHWIFAVQKNVTALPGWLLSYADAVNSDDITVKGLTLPQHHALLKELRVPLNTSQEIVNGIPYDYYPLSFSLVYHPRDWKTRAFNRGLYEYVWPGTPGTGTPEKRRIKDDEGEPVDEPQFLDEHGQKLPTPVDPADIVIIEGWNKELLPFNALPLT